MSVRPRFSLAKRFREIKLNVFDGESCNNLSLEDGEEYDPNFAPFYEKIKQNAQRRSRSSRIRNTFNSNDINVSLSLDSDDSADDDGSKLVLNENPLSPSRTQILVNVDDEYSADLCVNSNSEALSGEELSNNNEVAKSRKRKKRQSTNEIVPVVSQETTENLEDGTTVECRKSKRTRIKPCDYWRLQRPKYVRDSTGLAWLINGIEEGSKEQSIEQRVSTKRRPRKRLRQTSKDMNHDYSIHATKEELATNESRKKQLLESNILLDKSKLEWKASGSSGNGVQMALVKKDLNQAEAWGLLKIAGLAKKLSQETGDYTTYFTILQGKICVAVGNNLSAILDNCSIFEIPPNTIYSLENVRRDESLLQFMVKKRT